MSIYMYLLLYPILESFFWSFSFVTACRRSAYFSPRFNPRPRTGGDYKILFVIDLVYVSIHAPARGATASATIEIMQLPCFNPRPRTGGDPFHSLLPAACPFQSTPPHGGRLSLFFLLIIINRFQSTPPHGGRPFAYNSLQVK